MPPITFNTRKRKRTTTQRSKKTTSTSTTTELPTYIESDLSASEREVRDHQPELITVHGRKYYRASHIASKLKKKSKTSHVWEEEKGFKIIDMETKTKHYYCIECLDNKTDPIYAPLVVNKLTNITNHWQAKHSVDSKGNAIKKSLITEKLQSQPLWTSITELVFHCNFNEFKLLLI